MSETQASGFFRFKVGDVEVTSISDGVSPFPMNQLLQGASPETIDAELKRDFIPDPYPTSVNTFILRFPDKLVLIDTGAGATLGGALGQLPRNLEAAGVSVGDVQEIFLTHLHMDHDGGLTRDDKELFPQAMLRVNEKDIAEWLNRDHADQADKASTAQPKDAKLKFTAVNFKDTIAAVKPYQDAGRLQPFKADTELLPGLRAQAAPGHTVGHTIFTLERKGASLTFWGDTVHVAEIQVRRPEITIMFDTDPDEAAEGRKKVLRQVAEAGALIAGSHLPFPGVGHIRMEGDEFRYLPLDYQPDFSQPAS